MYMMKRILWTLILVFSLVLAAEAQVCFGKAELFNDAWKFQLGEESRASESDFNDARWRSVLLPHDWSVEAHLSPDQASCMGYLPGGIGWYRKHFDGRRLTEDKAYIYFEGVYCRSAVYLNGHLLGERPNGYVSFLYDMTPYLNREGDNVLAVRVDHSMSADSRFYTGSGIYRDVWLVSSGQTHFAQWGIRYEASKVSARSAVLKVNSAVEGPLEASCRLALSLKDKDGRTVARAVRSAKPSQETTLSLSRPRLWDVEHPYLYRLEASLLTQEGTVLDRAVIPVGIRSLQFDANRGFALNGRWIKVKGVCLHHDAGVLGAAVPKDVMARRLVNLKQIGTNAIRTSHNPQSPAFYDLCDSLGLLVMDEAFDEWEFPKNKWLKGWNVGTPGHQGTYDYFEEWSERDLGDMVRRDRNHPCIFLWSIGNEVDYPNDPYSHPILNGDGIDFTQPISGGYKPDAPDAMRIGKIAKRLADCVRQYDTSRPVTGALAGVVMSNETGYPEAIDVVGYNYTESRYQKDHEKYPDRIIYGSENRTGYADWKAVRDNEHIFGQFIWTGCDYLGESRAWPSRGFYSGMLDFGSFVKPAGKARAAMWCDSPVCFLGTGRNAEALWNYPEGQRVRVVCYTNAPSARLMLNGQEVGEVKSFDDELGYIAWEIPYAAGTLKAEALDPEGKVLASDQLVTSRQPYAIRVSADKRSLASSREVSHLLVEIVDVEGNPVPQADNMIQCRIEGPGRLLGLEASDNTDMTDYGLDARRVYHGRLLAYVSASGQGKIQVKFSSNFLQGATMVLEAE